MLRLLIKFVHWLEVRFPEKRVVNVADYETLQRRLALVETNAVHKEAVQILIKEIAQLKADHLSFKASLGFRPNPELNAVLNGESISNE